MTNKPYVKKFDNHGKLENPITKDQPYLHPTSTTRSKKREFKYLTVRNILTGAYIGEVKRGGNNRKPCSSAVKRKGVKKREVHAM